MEHSIPGFDTIENKIGCRYAYLCSGIESLLLNATSQVGLISITRSEISFSQSKSHKVFTINTIGEA